MSKEKNINVKKKLDGNRLDLSLSDLSIVPVKEIAALPKATNLDLSCNLLHSIPNEFCQLVQLVHLDLSKNHLESLPDDFGNLTRLQHLDLLQNQLTLLPVSFSQLDNLKWLDVGENPLDESLKIIAGNCLNESQCKQCAKNVVAYLKSVQDEIDRRERKKLQNQKELEKQQKEAEELERQRKKAQKLAEKERRKKEFEGRRATEDKKEEVLLPSEDIVKETQTPYGNKAASTTKKSIGCRQLVCKLFTYIVVVLLLSLAGLLVLCNIYPREQVCFAYRHWLQVASERITNTVSQR